MGGPPIGVAITGFDIKTGVWTAPGHGFAEGQRVAFIDPGIDAGVRVASRHLPRLSNPMPWMVNVTPDTFQLVSAASGGVPLTYVANPAMDLSRVRVTKFLVTQAVTLANLPPAPRYRVVARMRGYGDELRFRVLADAFSRYMSSSGLYAGGGSYMEGSGFGNNMLANGTELSGWAIWQLDATIDMPLRRVTITGTTVASNSTAPEAAPQRVVGGTTIVPVEAVAEQITSITLDWWRRQWYGLAPGSRIEIWTV